MEKNTPSIPKAKVVIVPATLSGVPANTWLNMCERLVTGL
jgi:hypothetical protein